MTDSDTILITRKKQAVIQGSDSDYCLLLMPICNIVSLCYYYHLDLISYPATSGCRASDIPQGFDLPW